MPRIGNPISTSEIPCDRCGSKRKITKTWTERIKNDNGVMTLEHKEIKCTNKICQADFEAVLKKENEKRAKIHQIKLENDAKRLREKESRMAATQ